MLRHGARGPRRGRQGGLRRRRRARGTGGQLRRPHGRAWQLGGHHQPDPRRDRPRPRRQAPVQRPRPRPCARRGDEDRLQGRRQAGRGDDPHGHPGGVGGRHRRGRARQRRRGGPRGDGRCRGAGRRKDAVPAADPARGARRRLGRAGPVPPVPGRARGGARPPGEPRRSSRRTGHQRGDARGAGPRRRGRRVRLRDRVPAARPGGDTARRPGDPGAPREHRRLGAGRGRRAPGQGPRPQRAPRRGHRVRPLDRDPVADHDREPRQPGARRPGDQGGGVRRRDPGRRRRPGR